jgi:hypothetical protein
MNCPDCGTKLTEQPALAGVVWRCFKCGGFWLDADTANNLTPAELANWRRISVSTTYLSGGKGICPADGTNLEKYAGEQVPAMVVVKRCGRCGRWWFPGDNLFAFKPAAEAKKNYLRLWGLPVRTSAVLLPLALIAVLLGGTIVGVKMVGQQQQTQVTATSQLTEFSGTYLGAGKALIGFKTKQPAEQIEYRGAGDGGWKMVKTELINGFNIVWLEGLIEGRAYTIRILGEEYGFVAK